MGESSKLAIWIDNDGCPVMVRDLVLKAGQRLGGRVVVVSNRQSAIPRGFVAEVVVVPGGFDAADDYIATNVQPLDLVITADVPLASRVVNAGAMALNPRGEVYDQASIGEQLAFRNLMQELRSGGQVSGGPPPLGEADRKRFANALDRLLTQLTKSRK